MLHVGKRVVQQADLILTIYLWQGATEVSLGNLLGGFGKTNQRTGDALDGSARSEIDRQQTEEDQCYHADNQPIDHILDKVSRHH